MSEVALPAGSGVREYVIERVLGEGGFGITYEARHVHLAGRFAIKEYFPWGVARRESDGRVTARSTPDAEEAFRWGLDRFVEEAQTLELLDHPAIVKVRDVFVENGSGFMVMEFVDGETLEERVLRAGPLPEAEVIELVRRAADGLAAVHGKAFLHRDVKPSNIMLRGDTPVLIDFGAARRTDTGKATTTMLKSHGFSPIEFALPLMGTGPWSDIYSLAATAFFALTGEAPPDAQEKRYGAPSDPIRKLGAKAGASRFLKQIDAALAVKPGDRPQSVAAWIAAMDIAPTVADANEGPPDLVPLAAAIGAFGVVAAVAVGELLERDPTTFSGGAAGAIAGLVALAVLGGLAATAGRLVMQIAARGASGPRAARGSRGAMRIVGIVLAPVVALAVLVAFVIVGLIGPLLLPDWNVLDSAVREMVNAGAQWAGAFGGGAFAVPPVVAPWVAPLIARPLSARRPTWGAPSWRKATAGLAAASAAVAVGPLVRSALHVETRDAIVQLGRSGLFPGDVPDELDDQDHAAIRQAQAEAGLPQTGELDRATIRAIRRRETTNAWTIDASKGHGRREIESALYYCDGDCVLTLTPGTYDLGSTRAFLQPDPAAASEQAKPKSEEAKGIVLSGQDDERTQDAAQAAMEAMGLDPTTGLTLSGTFNLSGVDSRALTDGPIQRRRGSITLRGVAGRERPLLTWNGVIFAGADALVLENLRVRSAIQTPGGDSTGDEARRALDLRGVSVECPTEGERPRALIDVTSGSDPVRLRDVTANAGSRCGHALVVSLGTAYRDGETVPVTPQGPIEIVNSTFQSADLQAVWINAFLENTDERKRAPKDPLTVTFDGGRLASGEGSAIVLEGNASATLRRLRLDSPGSFNGVFTADISRATLDDVTGACVLGADRSRITLQGGSVQGCGSRGYVAFYARDDAVIDARGVAGVNGNVAEAGRGKVTVR